MSTEATGRTAAALALLERTVTEARRRPQVWLDRLDGHHDELLVALRWLGEHGPAGRSHRLAHDLLTFWSSRSNRFAVAAARAARASSLRSGTRRFISSDRPHIAQLCDACRDLVVRLGVRQQRADALARDGLAAERAGDAGRAAYCYALAQALYTELDDTSGASVALEGLRRLTPASASPGPTQGRLTRREREVLALVARGLTNRQIAAALTISLHTATRHVVHVFDKLAVHSRAEATAWYVRTAERDGGYTAQVMAAQEALER